MKKIMILALAVLGSSCTISIPDIQLTGEKTALQKQVLGEYEELESDDWVIASARLGTEGQSMTFSGQKQTVLEAIKNQKFRQDEVVELKRDKVIGENNEGFLEIVNSQKLDTPEEQARVEQLVKDENADRKIIYERALAVMDIPVEWSRSKIDSMFAAEKRNQTESGTLVQNAQGEWIEKIESKE
ncbi:DUF1318 domain-containing protein [candidate division KSB1 bacterium]|nr:DUF1318 domain-containing protein [candidate division KSB1 bacterium]